MKLKKIVFYCIALGGVFNLPFSMVQGADADSAVNSFANEKESSLSTAEAKKLGAENVKSVMAQLETLFIPSAEAKKTIKKRPVTAPYYRIIPGADGRSTLIYRCRYTPVEALLNSVESIISDGYAEQSKEQNMLIVNERSERMEELKNALLAIDIPSPQVLVEAKIVEVLFNDGMQRNFSVTFNDSELGQTATGENKNLNSSAGATAGTLGNAASNQGGAMDFYPYVSGTKNLHTSFQWLLNAQDAKILSSPNIVVSRNEEAKITTGQDIPIQSLQNTQSGSQISTTFRNVGVTLNVSPKMIDDNSVTIKVNPQVSNVLSYQKITQGSDSSGSGLTTFDVPVISIRSIETELTLQDGQLIMMGGLYSNREMLRQERIPFLSDMPYFGELFTSKNREKEVIQLLFILRIHILNPDEVADGILYDPEAIVSESEELGNIIQNSPGMPGLQKTIDQVKSEFLEPLEEPKEKQPENNE